MAIVLFVFLGIALLIATGYIIGDNCLFFMLHDGLTSTLAVILTACGILSIVHAIALLVI